MNAEGGGQRERTVRREGVEKDSVRAAVDQK